MKDDTRIIIFYHNREAFSCECRSTGTDIRDTVRYWMGKSPGMYRNDIYRIISVPMSSITDQTHVLRELDQEQARRYEEYQESRERAQYEKLKDKYEKGYNQVR